MGSDQSLTGRSRCRHAAREPNSQPSQPDHTEQVPAESTTTGNGNLSANANSSPNMFASPPVLATAKASSSPGTSTTHNERSRISSKKRKKTGPQSPCQESDQGPGKEFKRL